MPSARRASLPQRIVRSIGPGFITGAADDDPSGILTYAQTGAQFGYAQLWTVVLSLPFMIAIQEMCGRIGLVTGKGLAGVIRRHYSGELLWIAVALLFVANTINIGADLGAMAASAQMIFGASFWLWLGVIAGVTLLLEIFIPYPTYARYLKYLTLSLFAYVCTAFLVTQDWSEIALAAVQPTFSVDRAFLMNIVAIFGTTIAPYLFFWQADEEVEEEVERHQLKEMGVGKPHITKKDVAAMRLDTGIGMAFSNAVAFFIMITAASTLHRMGIDHIGTAVEGAEALRPLAGEFAAFLFAAGVIGTGMIAVPVLAGSASYAVAESIGWKEGLSKKWWQAKGFYAVIVLSTMLGLLLNAVDIPPFRMLYYTAVLNGLAAPLLMGLILLIANNKRIMGSYRNSWTSNVPGIAITAFMTLAAGAFLFL